MYSKIGKRDAVCKSRGVRVLTQRDSALCRRASPDLQVAVKRKRRNEEGTSI